jgi:hypothetical protein
MTPIPEIYMLSSEMFTDLKGDMFFDTVRILNNLQLDSESVITEPPGKKINVTSSTFRDSSFEKSDNICIPKAFLIRGKDIGQNLSKIVDLGLIPKRVDSIENNKILEPIFGIKLNFYEKTQIISITKEGEKSINLQHDGLYNPIDINNRYAILALCIAPDKLWSDICKNGFIFGELYGKEYDFPWSVKALSINLPYNKYSYDRTLGGKGVLDELSISSLAKIGQRKSLQPIGLFIDSRTHKF